jgi:hypothetical protein
MKFSRKILLHVVYSDFASLDANMSLSYFTVFWGEAASKSNTARACDVSRDDFPATSRLSKHSLKHDLREQ